MSSAAYFTDSIIETYDGVELEIVFTRSGTEAVVDSIKHKGEDIHDLLDEHVWTWAQYKAEEYMQEVRMGWAE